MHISARWCHGLALVGLLTAVLGGTNAWAFGANGHRIVAQLAEAHLTPEARAAVQQITGGQPLAMLATWPDFLYSDPAWRHASPWHYVSIEDDQTVANYPRKMAGDVLQALVQFEAALRDPDTETAARREALAFYTHLVGDVHQPLHVGRSADQGGNTIPVTWLGTPSNLHKVWDTDLIEHEQLSYTEYVAFLSFIGADDIAVWQAASYSDWAQESVALRAVVYDFGEQKTRDIALGWDYNFRHKATINRRLQQAGMRLAGKLNAIFGAASAQP